MNRAIKDGEGNIAVSYKIIFHTQYGEPEILEAKADEEGALLIPQVDYDNSSETYNANYFKIKTDEIDKVIDGYFKRKKKQSEIDELNMILERCKSFERLGTWEVESESNQ